MKNFYKNMKKQIKQNENANIYLSNLSYIENVLLSMFEYKNLPDNVYTEYIERAFIRYGCCAFGKIKDRYFTNYPVFSGDLDDYGIGTEAHIISINGESKVEKVNGGIAVGWNNSLHKPDFDVLKYLTELSETEISMACVVKNSRLSPIFLANDGKEADSIKSILDSIYDGKPHVITNKNAFIDIITEGDNKKLLNLTNVDDIEKIQYLSKYHDDILSRFGMTYGFNMQATGKMAQQTVQELSGYEALSKVIPSDRLKCRREFVDNINRIFDLDITVDFSEIWKKDKNEYIGGDNDDTSRINESV